MAPYSLLKPLLFALPAETAHRLAMGALAVGCRVPGVLAMLRRAYGWEHPSLRIRVWNREFSNPVGLAAGFDKDGVALAPLLALGFGFAEAGTVTPRPQAGNPRPRLFRLPGEEALINRMGFNNAGAAALAGRLRRFRAAFPAEIVGVNLGKNLDTPLEEAAGDYISAYRAVAGLADYLVVNVSSPNTPGLRGLQTRAALVEILEALSADLIDFPPTQKQYPGTIDAPPLLVKVSPDLDQAGLREIAAAALEAGCDGLIATNTTLGRDGLNDPRGEATSHDEAGGLSGQPLHQKALETVASLRRFSEGKLTLIGVGGIASAEQAYRFIRAGASLVQLYSGLVYQGPGLVRRIKIGLAERLERDGFSSLREAVGADVPL
ncbi:MAG: quinone-dependent dihydroorotate dehydrogenase [SAR324 cluster bacterium]|nr:quinone-dependent dihydroorotate dehydrogenase [SAR324 cluster bacterium]